MNLRPLKRRLVRGRVRIWPRINVRLAPRCQDCGYSLVGLAGKGVERCPECGRLLQRHEFAGLYRVRGRTAWLVSACVPVLTVAAPMLWLVHDQWPARRWSEPSRLQVAMSMMLLTAVGSGAMVIAMARSSSAGKPLIIRATNWNGAMMGIAVLGLFLASLLIAASSSTGWRP